GEERALGQEMHVPSDPRHQYQRVEQAVGVVEHKDHRPARQVLTTVDLDTRGEQLDQAQDEKTEAVIEDGKPVSTDDRPPTTDSRAPTPDCRLPREADTTCAAAIFYPLSSISCPARPRAHQGWGRHRALLGSPARPRRRGHPTRRAAHHS